MGLQIGEYLAIGHNYGVLPAVSLQMALTSMAEQHYRRGSPHRRTMSEVALIVVTMAVRGPVVLDDDRRIVPRKNNVSDIHADRTIGDFLATSGVDLLDHAVAGRRRAHIRRESAIHTSEQDALEGIAKVMSGFRGQ